jgi:methylated-DNA-[protein]-cysteine S-methyltransferase
LTGGIRVGGFATTRAAVSATSRISAAALISRFDRTGRLAIEMTDSPGWTICESPIGLLTMVAGASGRGITQIYFEGHTPRLPEAAKRPMPGAVAELDAYFAGERRAFELDLDLQGKPLQRKVWQQLLEIPYGLEPYRRPRVVGSAIGRNPVPVVVPCHRVIGADGSLTGYFGGLERKKLLLDLEGVRLAGSAPERAAARKDQLAML